MYIINTIPISKGVSTSTLSYFSKKEMPIGSVIKIPLRKKKILGVVVSSQKLKDLKAIIKSADFKMKKIEDESFFEIFRPEFINATQKASEYYASFMGVVLNALAPATILQNPEKLVSLEKQKKSLNKKSEVFAIEDTTEERISRYKNIIREEFAKNNSVFICVPTLNDAEFISHSIKKGLEDFVFVLHGYLSKNKIISVWNEACEKKHPIVIVGTGKFLSIPRNDIKTIIIEKENSFSFKMDSRPFLDIRKFAEFLGKEIGTDVVFGDDVLRIETLYRHKEKEIFEMGHIKTRYDNEVKILIENIQKNNEKKFQIVGDGLDNII
jgi:primosomal protein N'